jgi:hypothetical protein
MVVALYQRKNGSGFMKKALLTGITGQDGSHQLVPVKCPVCSLVTEVEGSSDGLYAHTFQCSCGTVINNELGYFSRPAAV